MALFLRKFEFLERLGSLFHSILNLYGGLSEPRPGEDRVNALVDIE